MIMGTSGRYLFRSTHDHGTDGGGGWGTGVRERGGGCWCVGRVRLGGGTVGGRGWGGGREEQGGRGGGGGEGGGGGGGGGLGRGGWRGWLGRRLGGRGEGPGWRWRGRLRLCRGRRASRCRRSTCGLARSGRRRRSSPAAASVAGRPGLAIRCRRSEPFRRLRCTTGRGRRGPARRP